MKNKMYTTYLAGTPNKELYPKFEEIYERLDNLGFPMFITGSAHFGNTNEESDIDVAVNVDFFCDSLGEDVVEKLVKRLRSSFPNMVVQDRYSEYANYSRNMRIFISDEGITHVDLVLMLGADYRMVSLAQQVLNNIPTFPQWTKDRRKKAFTMLVNFGAVDFVMNELRRMEYTYRLDKYVVDNDNFEDDEQARNSFVDTVYSAYFKLRDLALAGDYTEQLKNVLEFQSINSVTAKALWNVANEVFHDCHTKGMDEYFRNVDWLGGWGIDYS